MCPHCQSNNYFRDWEEPDGLLLLRCLCGYVGYDFRAPTPDDMKPEKFVNRTFGKWKCATCNVEFVRRAPTQMYCDEHLHVWRKKMERRRELIGEVFTKRVSGVHGREEKEV